MIVWATIKITTALALASATMLGIGALTLALPASLPIFKAAAIGMGILAMVAGFLIVMAWGIEKFFNYLSGIDADSLADGADNAFKIIDTINWALLKLAPIFIILAGMAIGLAVLKEHAKGVYAAIFPMMKVALALVVLSPLIAAGLTLLARAIIGLVTATSNMVALDPVIWNLCVSAIIPKTALVLSIKEVRLDAKSFISFGLC